MDKRKRIALGPQRSKNTPVQRATTANKRRSVDSIPTMDKNSMLVMEANEISQYLKKDFVFEMKADVSRDDSQLQVRVRNTRTKQICVWPLLKLKERLNKMRKLMYADEAEGQGIGGDTVFFDAADVWIPEDQEQEMTNTTASSSTSQVTNATSSQKNENVHHPYDNKSNTATAGHHKDSNILNGHGNHRDFHSNHQHSNSAIATLSNEEALPSVSVSVAFQSTHDTIKLPNGFPDTQHPRKKHASNADKLISTTSSELPGDSEFLRMSLNSTLNSTLNSPMSPPPPPKDFGQDSSTPNHHVGQRGLSASGQVLPEKYLTTSSSNAHAQQQVVVAAKENSAFKQAVPAQQETRQTVPQQAVDRAPQPNSPLKLDPMPQQNHRPIIKSRSPNVTPTNVLKHSRKIKPRDASISFNMDVQSNSSTSSGSDVKDSGQSKKSTQCKTVPKHLSQTTNYPQSSNSRNTSNVIRREISSRDTTDGKNLPSRDSTDSHKQTNKSHHMDKTNQEQSNVCQHCKYASSTESHDLRLPKKNKRIISSLRMCRDMIKTLSHRCKGPSRGDTFVDRIMYNCESIKIAVINILEAYTQAQDSQHDMAAFADSELVKLTSLQLVSAMELLVSHTTLWSTTIDVTQETDFVKEACTRITNTVKDLGKEMVLFLQACETDNDTLASESASKIIDQLYELIKFCGQVAIATNTCPILLIDKRKHSTIDELLSMKTQRDDDLLDLKPSMDMKQSFLTGCDVWMEQCMTSGIKSVQDCELRAQMLSEDCYASQESGTEVAKHAYITTTTSKILLLKCQELHVDISDSMKQETTKEENYLHQYFSRCHHMVQHLTTLVDCVSLLSNATEPLIDDEDPGTLRKISRCAEMIFRTSNKLAVASNFDMTQSNIPDTPRSITSLNGITLDMRTDDFELSNVITDSQCEQVDHCSEDVKLATQALCAVIRRRLPVNDASTSASKVKRMLPATPGVASGNKQTMRCKSAKQPERMRRSLSYYDVNAKKSNEV